jgi:hypothetical protein
MLERFRYQRTAGVITVLAVAVFVLTRCMNKGGDKNEATGFEAYAGSAKCFSCHKEIHDSHIRTAHFLTGQPATDSFVKGSFEEGENRYSYNPELFVKMDKEDSGFYQTDWLRCNGPVFSYLPEGTLLPDARYLLHCSRPLVE